MKKKDIDLLMQFGFTKLEAEIYIALLEEPNSTGYRIAQILGKPLPNTYKALHNLKNKKVVISDESLKTQVYAAVPISEYLDYKTLEFNAQKKALATHLRHYETKKIDEGIHRLHNIDDIFSRAQKMIHDAQDIVLVDIFPNLLEKFKETLEATSKEGVRVIVKSYIPTSIPKCEIIYSETESTIVKQFFGEWLNIVVDGKEHLLAFVDKDERRVFEAFWSKNVFLSLIIYNGFSSEFVLSHLRRMLEENKTKKDLVTMLNTYDSIKTSETSAFKEFLNRFTPDKES